MSFDTSSSPNVFFARSIFKRCVKCESAAPSCPPCEKGTTCTMISQSCNQCATTKCIRTSSGGSSSGSGSNSSGGGTNAGAIAGGVIGGLAFVAILVGLVWWFFIRKKRNEYSLGGGGNEGQEKRSATSQQARKSTNSIASTVRTRASNVIQIAYIPGVTNRSPPDTPSLVPPVPPLPGAVPDQHFFMPGDLRDSSFTDLSNDRRSGAPSISPSLRSSVATTTSRNNAIVSPMPAQQATRTRAAVVSIHGNNQPTTTATAAITPPDAPAVPAITQAQLAKAGVTEANNNSNNNNNSSIVARTMTAKPVMVKTAGGSVKKNNNNAVQAIEEQSDNSSNAPVFRSASTKQEDDLPASGFDDSSDEEDEGIGTRLMKSVKRTNTSKTTESSKSSPAANQGPFTDQPATNEAPCTSRTSFHLEPNNNNGAGSNRSSREPPARVSSPFSDANEVR